MSAAEQNRRSRVETLTVLFNRFMERADLLDADDMVAFTTPMCDVLLRAIGQLDDYAQTRNVEQLLKAFSR